MLVERLADHLRGQRIADVGEQRGLLRGGLEALDRLAVFLRARVEKLVEAELGAELRLLQRVELERQRTEPAAQVLAGRQRHAERAGALLQPGVKRRADARLEPAAAIVARGGQHAVLQFRIRQRVEIGLEHQGLARVVGRAERRRQRMRRGRQQVHRAEQGVARLRALHEPEERGETACGRGLRSCGCDGSDGRRGRASGQCGHCEQRREQRRGQHWLFHGRLLCTLGFTSSHARNSPRSAGSGSFPLRNMSR